MLTTQACGILALLAGASLVNAHGYVYSWTVNGEVHPGAAPGESSDGAARPTENSNWGPSDRDSGIVACGGSGSAPTSWNLDAGSSVIAQWSGGSNGKSVWPEEHHGPVLAYMANCGGSSCDGVAAESLDWFKVAEETWDGTEWPSARITREDNWAFNIPADIAPGAYLVRTEIIAMHYEWEKGGFQVYPYCFQADVTGSGSAVPSDTAKFPAIYDPSNYEWYDYDWRAPGDADPRDPADYVPPGPAVYTGGGASAPATGGSTSASASASATVPSASSPAEDSGSDSPSPTEGTSDPEPSSETDLPAEVTTTDAEDSESTPTASPEASSVDSGSDATTAQSSSRTRSRWGYWRGSKSSTAAQAVETEEAEEEEGDEEDEEYRKRNVLARHQARQIAAF